MKVSLLLMASFLACLCATPQSGIAQGPRAEKPPRATKEEDKPNRQNSVDALREALGKAIGGAIREGIQDVFAKLKISDEIEAGILSAALTGKSDASLDAISIVLLRPAETKESSEAYEFRNDEQHFRLRMTKVRSNGVSRPIGIIVHTAVRDGQIVAKESILQLRDGKWTKERNGISEEVERGMLLDEYERAKRRFIR